MSHSPEEIVSYEFRTRTRGYDREEVDGFLDTLADQIEAHQAELASLRSRLEAVAAELAESRQSESIMKRALATVQDSAERQVEEQRVALADEAAETRRRAEQEATDVRQRAEAAAAEQEALVRQLQQLDEEHRRQLRSHLEHQLAALDELPDPFTDLAGPTARPGEPTAEQSDHRPPPSPPPAAGSPAGDAAESTETATPTAEPDDATEVIDPWRRADHGPSAGAEPDEAAPTAAEEAGSPPPGGDGGDADDEDRHEPPMWG